MSNVKQKVLSTSDNPWNPFKNYEEWRQFDTEHGYCCEAYQARMSITSVDMPEDLYTQRLNDDIEDILEFNMRYKDPRLPDGVEYIAVEEE
jgi:hypothetical protein